MIVTSNTLQPLSNNEPEPYATTDILRAEKEKLQQNHYSVNIYVFYLLFMVSLGTIMCSKGQIISKANFEVFI